MEISAHNRAMQAKHYNRDLIKRYPIKCIGLLLILMALSGGAAYAQDASQIYKKTVSSTVTIVTNDGGVGSGFFVKENVIATNYHVIKGKTTASCFTANPKQSYLIEGCLGVDIGSDLVLLKVYGARIPPLKIATSSQLQPGKKVYVIGTPQGLPATISDGIISGISGVRGDLIQITAPISPGSSGGPVLNTSGELIGISVLQFTQGQNLNFAIPKSYLEKLLRNMWSNPRPLAYLYNYEATRDKIIALSIDKPELSLDYLVNSKDNSTFLFTYRQNDRNQPFQTIWRGNFYLVDLDTGKAYPAIASNLPTKDDPRVLYNKTRTKFYVSFERLPLELKRFNIVENNCEGNDFCFLDIEPDDTNEVSDLNANSYLYSEDEGTATFYTDCNEGEPISLSIEGYEAGELTHYFDRSYSPQCGESGTLAIRLKAGTYNYTARNNIYSWRGKVTITKNGCTKQRLLIK